VDVYFSFFPILPPKMLMAFDPSDIFKGSWEPNKMTLRERLKVPEHRCSAMRIYFWSKA
jgi:hypothetical protein